jgi:hypothetical protein
MRAKAVTQRLDRVAATRQAGWLDAEVRRMAAQIGVAEAELRHEAEEVERVCRVAGAVTAEERVAAVAAAIGVTVDELRQELEQVRLETSGAAG